VSHFRDAYAEFRRLNTEIAAVSVDSPFSHREWARELKIPFPMLSDFNREFLRAYHVRGLNTPHLADVAGYFAFVVDSAGIIRHIWSRSESDESNPVEEVLAVVRGLPEPELV
jgi:glutaredoxin-dependent peroxiredoxin